MRCRAQPAREGTRSGLIVLAATNRVDMLRRALLRPGRFDRQITVTLTDRFGREAILRVHTRRTPLHDDVRLDTLARLTIGMSGAELANLVNEAALCAARRSLDALTRECFEEALVHVQLGARRPLVMSEMDRRIIATHESGHALVAYYLPGADTVNCITILPYSQRLGRHSSPRRRTGTTTVVRPSWRALPLDWEAVQLKNSPSGQKG